MTDSLTPEQADLLRETNAAIDGCHICAQQGYVAISSPISRGAGRRRVMLVGQAPGRYEETRKRAFSGPAGRTLMRWFADIGLPEADVRDMFYISAVTRCFPGSAVGDHGGDRNPSPPERANCRPYLLREIAIIRPPVLVLIGGTAIKEVYGNAAKLSDLIGSTTTSTLGDLLQKLAVRATPRQRLLPLMAVEPDGGYSYPARDLPPVLLDPDAAAASVTIHHLPHPSGASTWLNDPDNRLLLRRSLDLLRDEFVQLGLIPPQ